MSYAGAPYNSIVQGDSSLPPETISSFQRAMGEIQGLPARAQLLRGLMQQTAPSAEASPSPWGSMATAGSAVMNALTQNNMADQYRAAHGNQMAANAPATAGVSYGQQAQSGMQGGVAAPAIGGNTTVSAPAPQLPLPKSLLANILSGGTQ